MNALLQHPSPPKADSAPRWQELTGTGRLLVVDDSEAIRIVVSRILMKLGFTADLAANGSEALSMFTTNPGRYALALVDVKLPGISGIDVVREIRRIRPETPAILMSGYSQDKVESASDGSHPTVMLNKPFSPESLAAALRAVLDH